jgi:hypothetical protein
MRRQRSATLRTTKTSSPESTGANSSLDGRLARPGYRTSARTMTNEVFYLEPPLSLREAGSQLLSLEPVSRSTR